jgi:hypothetical protein
MFNSDATAAITYSAATTADTYSAATAAVNHTAAATAAAVNDTIAATVNDLPCLVDCCLCPTIGVTAVVFVAATAVIATVAAAIADAIAATAANGFTIRVVSHLFLGTLAGIGKLPALAGWYIWYGMYGIFCTVRFGGSSIL